MSVPSKSEIPQPPEMAEFNGILSAFDSISLEEQNSNPLLDRQDTKFVFNRIKLPLVLEKLKSSFRVLHINNQRIIGYENLYFDTDDLLFYTQHHNQKLNRYKVRLRRYLEPNVCYVEIKFKSNKKRMIKKRMKIPRMSMSLDQRAQEMIAGVMAFPPERLSPKLKVKFSRISLVDPDFTNRGTIDFDIVVEHGLIRKDFENLVIAEVKQERHRPRTRISAVMRELGILEMRISKYCMGIVLTYDGVKYNRFKPKLLRINKIMSENSLMGETDG